VILIMRNLLTQRQRCLYGITSVSLCLCLFTQCTIGTTYLSFQDHLKKEALKTFTWRSEPTDSLTSFAIDTLARSINHLQSFLVLKDDKVVYESYRHGLTYKMPHNLKSVSKSITSLLTGIAIEKGYFSLSTDLKSIFGKEANVDSSCSKVSIQNLLTMQGGFPEIGSRYYWIVCASFNPVKSTLRIRRNVKPGDSTEYSDVGANLLGYAVSRTSKMKLEEFARRYLFSPLGISSDKWVTDLRGDNTSAADIFMCPRDLARIGYLMLHRGNVNGRQIVSEKWVDESVRPRTVIPGFPENLGYGYLWWLDSAANNNAFCAIGWGGQILYVSPDDNMIFVGLSNLKNRGWPIILEMIRKIVKLNRERRNS
jgi:CubicO group peptidase (beta-lactamase class C family)